MRPPTILVIFTLMLTVSCASGDPELETNNETPNANNTDNDVWIDQDTNAPNSKESDSGEPDTNTPIPPDPCDECEEHEICIDDDCIDLCAEQAHECGTWEIDGHEINCGGCSVGSCDDGQCPEVCEVFHAQCGEVYLDGQPHDCGVCSGLDRCMHNQCTAREKFVDIAAGSSHTCGLRSGGEIRCWGTNEYGQLGDNDQGTDSSTPVRVDVLNNAATLSSITNHSCAVRDDEHVYCWGRNGSGRLGDGTIDDRSSPVRATDITATDVGCGGSHTCALLQDTRISCWGNNSNGQLATGTTESSPDVGHQKQRVLLINNEELDQVERISLGGNHTCAVRRDNTLWCWGRNRTGQLGQGNDFDSPPYAERIIGIDPIYRVDAAPHHSCAIAVGGDVLCWGQGGQGEIGDGEAGDTYSPVQIDLPEPAIDISTGRSHTCAAVESGQVYCWGNNRSGQIGQGHSTGQFEEPTQVTELDDIHRVAAGGEHSCALDRSGDVHCWGANGAGQLGDESNLDRFSPVTVAQ